MTSLSDWSAAPIWLDVETELAVDFDRNPFSPSRLSNQSHPYLFDSPWEFEAVINRFAAAGFCAQITGPHGTGKSTLAIQLGDELANTFPFIQLVTIRSPFHIAIQGGGNGIHDPISVISHLRKLHASFETRPTCQMLIVDGLERLGSIGAHGLVDNLIRKGIGLIATTHRNNFLPIATIHQTKVDEEKYWAMVEFLQGDSWRRLSSDVIRNVWTRSRGNMRNAFFDLYDEYEIVLKQNLETSSLRRDKHQ